MTSIATIAELRSVLDRARAGGRTIGFVPTMGYLHAGHASLMNAARAAHGLVVTSIFVNPLQFGPSEDLDAYPRDLTGDTELAERCGVDLLFVPSTREMYPGAEPTGEATDERSAASWAGGVQSRPHPHISSLQIRTTVSVGGVSAVLEGRARPTHFDGVATVVAKLFAIVGACHAYFGEKDFQQLAVVRQMVRDLSIPVEVVACPTVREPDGLALSSRNAYLTPAERAAAPVVHAALEAGRAAVLAGERDPAVVRALMAGHIEAEPLAELDYAEVVDSATFVVPDPLHGTLRLLAAARFGRARLIDNVGVELPVLHRA